MVNLSCLILSSFKAIIIAVSVALITGSFVLISFGSEVLHRLEPRITDEEAIRLKAELTTGAMSLCCILLIALHGIVAEKLISIFATVIAGLIIVVELILDVGTGALVLAALTSLAIASTGLFIGKQEKKAPRAVTLTV